ncbi:MAG: hypothetical protein IJ005_03185 [Bacteroidales bacterium]|nr:hypothetical protein [Bacteroidales bacterium]
MKKILFVLSAVVMMLSCSCDNAQLPDNKDDGRQEPPQEETDTPKETVVTSDDIELSYWVDIDMIGYHRRGYWYTYSQHSSEIVPPDSYIENGVKMLVETYKANLLYIFYHRQFEIEAAKKVFLKWKEAAEGYNVKLVPTVLLQDYSNTTTPANSTMNFTDAELIDLAKWFQENFGEEVGIFDVYTRQSGGSLQDVQLTKLKEAIGDNLVFVGFQPGVNLSQHFKRAVEDTWTAECQGNTNDLWSNPIGGQNVGKKLLDNWVLERVRFESRPITWDLIPVAWDYEETTAKDQYGYVCPGDNALYNDPPIIGRLKLSKDAIFSHYEGGWRNKRLGGLSCDLTILQANSSGCRKDKTDFYEAIRVGKVYEGYFASAMNEIAEVYEEVYNEVKVALESENQ